MRLRVEGEEHGDNLDPNGRARAPLSEMNAGQEAVETKAVSRSPRQRSRGNRKPLLWKRQAWVMTRMSGFSRSGKMESASGGWTRFIKL